MKSKEMNIAIHQLDDFDVILPYASPLGDKAIPYIGWLWREVNFDAPSCTLGILPVDYLESNTTEKVGFMQNNKWDYEEFEVTGDEWAYLVEHIKTALKSNKKQDFETVYNYMQKLHPRYKK